jgi:hypothetical protein
MVKRFRSSAATGGVPVHILRDHFLHVFNRDRDPLPLVFYEPQGYRPSALDKRFTLTELDTATRELKQDKAPGPNGVGNDVLVSLYKLPDGRAFLLHLFNACFESGVLPDPWRASEIFVLYKGKGDVLDPNSYRGIALLDSCFKLYERLLYHRLKTWSFSHGCIPAAQFGFRANSGTLDAAFTFATLITKYVLAGGSPLFAALIDFQKAFPSVHREKLLRKLDHLGVTTKFLRALSVMFSGNTFSLRAGDMVTTDYPVITGLREGGVLSPLLFSLFIADMSDTVLCPFTAQEFHRHLVRDPVLQGRPLPGLLYADDLILLTLTEGALRIRLTRLNRYARLNCLTVNVKKSEVVLFGSQCSSPVFTFNGEELPLRRSCKYLGIWFESSGFWSVLTKEVLAKFKAAVVVFFQLCRKLRLSRLDQVHRLSHSLLFSVLYGVEFLTSVSAAMQLEQCFYRGVRRFYGLPNGVSNTAIRLLFPNICVTTLILRRKFSLLLRSLRPSDTYFQSAVLFDRETLLYQHGMGYSFILRDWLSQLNLEHVFLSMDRTSVRVGLTQYNDVRVEYCWDSFCAQRSTAFAGNVFGCHTRFYSFMKEVSNRSAFAVRIFMLIFCGSLSMSYTRNHLCAWCSTETFSTEHFFCCPRIGSDVTPEVLVLGREERWAELINLCLLRFHLYRLLLPDPSLTADESALFDELDVAPADLPANDFHFF